MDAALVLFEELDWSMGAYVLLGLQHSIKMDWKMMELCKSVERKRGKVGDCWELLGDDVLDVCGMMFG